MPNSNNILGVSIALIPYTYEVFFTRFGAKRNFYVVKFLGIWCFIFGVFAHGAFLGIFYTIFNYLSKEYFKNRYFDRIIWGMSILAMVFLINNILFQILR